MVHVEDAPLSTQIKTIAVKKVVLACLVGFATYANSSESKSLFGFESRTETLGFGTRLSGS